MIKYHGGDAVGVGFYFNIKNLEARLVSEKKVHLPGNQDQLFIKIPALFLLIISPLMGLAYIIYLPFVGFVLLSSLILSEIRKILCSFIQEIRILFSYSFDLGKAYFTGGRKPKKEEDEEKQEVSQEKDIDTK